MRANGLALPILLFALSLAASPALAKIDPSTSASPAPSRHALTLFNRLDADHDGALTGAELARLRRDAAGLFAALDLNGDGAIEKREFLSNAEGAGVGQRAALFARLDKNRDGRLARDEFAVTSRLLAALDSNQDRRVTPNEIRPGLAAPQPASPQPAPAPAETATAQADSGIPRHMCWIPLGPVAAGAALYPFGPECGH